MEKLDHVRAQQAQYDAEVLRLREELALTRQRDSQALGRALANGEPEPEAAGIEAEIERNVQRGMSMLGQIAEEQRQVSELIQWHKSEWRKDLERWLTDAGAVYRAAIVAMEAARADLVTEVQLGVWLNIFPETGGQVQTHLLPGDPETLRLGGPASPDVLAALYRESDELPLRGPVQPSQASLRALDRKHLVLQRVDPDGSVRPEVFEGDTEAGWKARDFVERLKRGDHG